MVKVRTRNEAAMTLRLQRRFPELNNGFSNGLSLPQIAQKIQKFLKDEGEEDSYFTQISDRRLARYVSFALQGFELKGKYYPGLMNDEEFEQRYKRRKIDVGSNLLENHGCHNIWKDDEKEFVFELYKSGVPPKKIYQSYRQREFTPRTFSGLEDLIVRSRKKGELEHTQRVFWDGDIDFTALALLARYGKEGNFLISNAKTLDEYFYNGEGRITKGKLSNFYKRNEDEVQIVLSENHS